MQIPNVKNVVHDLRKKVTYEVMATRELTRQELRTAVAAHLGDLEKSERPKRGQAVMIYSEL